MQYTRNMRIIDLTHTFDSDMPVYPGDPHAHLTQITTVADAGSADHELRTSMHVGTHMDAPMHMIEGGKYLSDMSPDCFVGRGVVIDARGRESLSEDLLDAVGDVQGCILLVCTGHSHQYRQSLYYERHPVFTEAFAEKAVRMGIKMIGMDTPSPDRPPFPVHHILLAQDILIVENLTNVESLLQMQTFTVVALPMKLHADAAPARVVALVE